MIGFLKGLFTAASGGWILYAIVAAGSAIAAGTGMYIWEHRAEEVQEARADAAEKVLAKTSEQLLQASESVSNYKAGLQQRDDLLNQQSAAFEAQRADLLRANADNESLKQRTRQAEEARDTEAAEIEAEAKAHPEQFVVIGPNVKARIPGLWK